MELLPCLLLPVAKDAGRLTLLRDPLLDTTSSSSQHGRGRTRCWRCGSA